MKGRSIVLVLALTTCLPSYAQLLMNAGDSFTYHFETLPFFQTTDPLLTPSGQFVLLFNDATLQSGDGLVMQMFEGTSDGPVISQLTISDFGQPYAPLANSPNAWMDHEGSVRVTALSGSFVINEIIMQRVDYSTVMGQIDIYQLRLTPVPEPNTVVLFIAGLVGSAWAVRRKRQRNAP